MPDENGVPAAEELARCRNREEVRQLYIHTDSVPATAAAYTLMLERWRQAQEAQGESSGPSFRVGVPVVGELTHAQRQMMEYRSRLEQMMMEASSSRMRSLAEMAEQFPMTAPLSERQNIGGIMKVSVRGPELSVREKAALKEGYKSLLRQGFGRLGVGDRKLSLWMDDRHYEIRTDLEYWEICGSSLYVGYGSARPGDKLRTVAERLAVTAGLMSLTGHASDPELMVEFEKALARMLAGQFEEVVKPLGVSGDDRPVGKMAWSATGVAAFVDGQWCSPVTGEPVEVGQGWTVIETGEEPREVMLTQSPVMGEYIMEDWERLVRDRRFTVTPLASDPDGPALVIGWGSERDSRELLEDVTRAGYMNLDVAPHRHGGWGICPARRVVSEPAPQQRNVAERFQEWLEVNAAANNRRRLEDGRWAFVWYGAGDSQRMAGVVELERRFGQPLGELEIGYDEYMGTNGSWWMVPRAVPVEQAVSVAERSRSQEDWEARLNASGYGTCRSNDGRLGINSTGETHFHSIQRAMAEFDLEYVTPHPTSGAWGGLAVVRRSESAPF